MTKKILKMKISNDGMKIFYGKVIGKKSIIAFLIKNNRWAVVLVMILLLLGAGMFKIQRNSINNWKEKYQSERKLKAALTDSVDYYQTKEGEWVAEKLTLQGRIKDILDKNNNLTEAQKELIKRIKESEREKSVIAAALIDAEAIIDSLKHGGGVIVDTSKKTVNFIEDQNPNINYKLKVSGVVPYPINTQPSLLFESLRLPNKSFVKFEFKDDKKEGYPISFSVTNSNEYMKVHDINSYTIPYFDKEVVDPTGWDKFAKWLNRNSKYVAWGVGGVAAGAGGTYLIMK